MDMHSVRVLEQAETTDKWKDFGASWGELFANLQSSRARIIFASSKAQALPAEARREISRQFRVPEYLFSEVCQQLNGYFWSGVVDDENEHLKRRSAWFRLLVKHTRPNAKPSDGYVWYEMEFFISWITLNQVLVICFETPKVFQDRLFLAVEHSKENTDRLNPYFFPILIMDEVITLHDESVWGLRDHIRGIEKTRLSNRRPEPNYTVLHEIARHTIHSVETLNVAVDVMTAIDHHYQTLPDKDQAWRKIRTETHSEPAQSHMQFQLQVLRNLRYRSQANEKRIHNEISFAYNSVAQRDSQVMLQIGEAARTDNATMRIIAIVTMTFLPATCVSAIFSMSFFSFTPGSKTSSGTWSISSKIWLYWVLVVPLTVFTLGTWFMWQRSDKRSQVGRREERFAAQNSV